MTRRFFILGLPRSRTAWLANFFTYDDVSCLHEPSAEIASLDELDARLDATGSPVQGSADTCNTLLFDSLLKRWPDARYIAVRRDPREVRASLRGKGLTTESMVELAASFESVTQHAAVIPVRFESLSDLSRLEDLWRFCGSRMPFNERRARMLIDLNVQHHDLHRLIASVEPERLAKLLSEDA